MKTIALEGGLKDQLVAALTRSELFHGMEPARVTEVVGQHGSLVQCEEGDLLIEAGTPADSFYLLLQGEASVHVTSGGEMMEVGRLKPPQTLGEVGLLLRQSRTATVIAEGQVVALKIDQNAFHNLFRMLPSFGTAVSKGLALRLRDASNQIPLPRHEDGEGIPPAEVLELLPLSFLQRHRILPLERKGRVLVLGFVDDPSSPAIRAARQRLPGIEFRPRRISLELFNRVMQRQSGLGEAKDSPGRVAVDEVKRSSPKLDALLARVVEEGASDLHLSGGQKPRWRIDGDMQELSDLPPFRGDEIFEMVRPIMGPRHSEEFDATSDTDLAYEIPGLARFRVNIFRDRGGVGAVLRNLPSKIMSFEELGLPPIIKTLCDIPKGLILVTGPTGSGKSTTLASMMDYLNRVRSDHIITLEDPVEFVYKSEKCLVNQREVFSHTSSFSRALRAALREDPDIILVGEMRDAETMGLAIETANTGHLVFGTLNTSNAVMTVDRVLGMFPPAQQPQIRATLADNLKGVISQMLCKKIKGGRVAAMEVMVSTVGISNIIREAKTHQLENSMVTGQKLGNILLNDSLLKLIEKRIISRSEALDKTLNKEDLQKKFLKLMPPGGAQPGNRRRPSR